MDRLISEKAVLNVLRDYYRAWFINDEGFMDAVNAIKAIPSAYNGMTNGEVIKIIFPQAYISKDMNSYVVEIEYDGGDSAFSRTYPSDWWNSLYKGVAISSAEPCDFAKWVANEIFDDMWECNKDAFAEIACRKLAKLGIVRAKGDEWELVEPQESEGTRCR